MKTRMHTKIVAMLIGVIGLAWPFTQAGAQVPSLLNYQGRVAVGSVNYDGVGQFRFALMNSGGSMSYWSNGVNAVTCTVVKGLYSVLLGDTNLANMAALPASVFTNADVRLRVWFAPEGSTLQQLAPDQRVAAAGYALNADQVDGLNSSAFALTSSSPTFTGTVTAAAFAGNGSGVTNVNADRVDGIHGAAFAQLSSSPTFTGTVTANGFSGNGAGVTNVNADQVDGLHGTAFAQLSSSPTFTGTVHAAAFSGNGAGLSSVNADELDGQHGTYYRNAANLTGTLNNVQLSTNAALLNAAQAFSQENHFLAKVGINVTNPQTRLEVRAASNGDGLRVDGAGGVAPAISLSTNGAVCGELALAAAGGQYSSDAVGGDVVLRNDVNGKVFIQHSSGGSALCVSTNNYVGVHKANPSTALDVNGTVTATNFVGGGAGLTNVNAHELDGLHASAFAELSSSPTFTGTVSASAFAGSGAELTHLGLVNAGGNSLTIGRSWGGDAPLQVCGSTWNLDQENNNYGAYYEHYVEFWQSFTCATDGYLAAVQTYAYSGGKYGGGGTTWTGTLRIFSGQGTGGALLTSQPVSGDDIDQIRTFLLETPVLLTVSNVYTFDIRVASSSITFRVSTDVYPGGRSSPSAGYDCWFRTYMMGQTQVTALVVQPNTLNVGIGTANPLCKLQVNAPREEDGIRVNGTNGISPTISFSTNDVLQGDLGLAAAAGKYSTDAAPGDIVLRSSSGKVLIQNGGWGSAICVATNNNVGIGVMNPTNKLQVAGHVQGTSFISSSDRNVKENVNPVSPDEILAGVSSLHIATWTFKNDSSGTHLGPMAQDFHAAFGLGNTDSGIFTVDADGVALAAIQGLNGKLEAELRAKDDRIQALESRMEKLEKMIDETRQQQAR